MDDIHNPGPMLAAVAGNDDAVVGTRQPTVEELQAQIAERDSKIVFLITECGQYANLEAAAKEVIECWYLPDSDHRRWASRVNLKLALDKLNPPEHTPTCSCWACINAYGPPLDRAGRSPGRKWL